MAKFVFNLEGVLRQRKHVEQEKQRDLAIKQSVQVTLQNSLTQVQNSIQNANDDLRGGRLVGKLDMSFLSAHRRFIAAMQRQGIGLMQRMAIAQRDVDAARLLLAEAAKQRKAIEKLREKQFERWREVQAKRELDAIDEVGMQLAYENLSNETDRA